MRVDFHSHFLPGIDDGAKTPEESVAILKYLKANDISVVCATPHYSMRHESIDSFIERRTKSYERLCSYMKEKGVSLGDVPKIVLGAEVALYRGLCDVEGLEKLCFGDKSILLELQFAPLGGWETEEVYNVMYQHGVRPVMAHINRYTKMFSSSDYEELFLNGDVTIQINSEVSGDFFGFGKMKKIIKSGLPVVFGCDIHSPRLTDKSGLEKLKKFLGSLSEEVSEELTLREKTCLEIQN